MRKSGWTGFDIIVTSEGKGRYELSDYPTVRKGSFSITPQQFGGLRQRLGRYERMSVKYTDESAVAFIEQGCPKGVPYITDAGALYVRWIGPKLDQHFLADFECDHIRNKARNDELREIFWRLPVPLP